MSEFHREILKVKDKEGRCFGLIETENNYIVACYYDPSRKWGEQWGHGIYFQFLNEEDKNDTLRKATNRLLEKVNESYISRSRLEELATLFKDGLISDDRESAFEYFDEICEMSEEEKSFFGIEESSPLANTKFENPMYNKGYDDGFSDGANSIEGNE